MCNVQVLRLNNNKIGDVGLQAFADALGKGALASLNTLYVDDGPLGTEHPALMRCAWNQLGLEFLPCTVGVLQVKL
jgi:hypothetical protein